MTGRIAFEDLAQPRLARHEQHIGGFDLERLFVSSVR
jgi:hypothetical protein